jgi:hypothetical protein
MGVGELHEMEVVGLRPGALVGEQAGSEGDAGKTGEFQEVAAIRLQHDDSPPQ